jgi:hypothetical protein
MQLVVWIFGVLILVISALAGIIWRGQQKRLAILDASMKILLERSDFVAHKSMDSTREMAWLNWREQVEKRFDNHSGRLEMNEREIARLGGRMNGKRHE